jgi:hypothetical protein
LIGSIEARDEAEAREKAIVSLISHEEAAQASWRAHPLGRLDLPQEGHAIGNR